jgi:hypothetical protein
METDLTKRYWVFVYPHYYPSGGLEDLHASFETLPFAQAYLAHELGARMSTALNKENKWSYGEYDAGQILDTVTREIYLIDLDTGKLKTGDE